MSNIQPISEDEKITKDKAMMQLMRELHAGQESGDEKYMSLSEVRNHFKEEKHSDN